MKVNAQETLRLVLRHAFVQTDPVLTSDLLDLYRKCPTLLSRSLSRTDRGELQKQVLIEETEFELSIYTTNECTQRLVTVINKIPPSEVCKAVHRINSGRELPLRPGDANMTEMLCRQIRRACHADYKKDLGWPWAFGNHSIQWSRKLAFTDR